MRSEQWNQHQHRWRPRSTTAAKGGDGTSVVGGGRDQEEDEGEDESSKSSTCLFSSARRRRQGKHGVFGVIVGWLDASTSIYWARNSAKESRSTTCKRNWLNSIVTQASCAGDAEDWESRGSGFRRGQKSWEAAAAAEGEAPVEAFRTSGTNVKCERKTQGAPLPCKIFTATI